MIPAIEVSSVSKKFGEVVALEDVSLSVERGELFGLIGPDGAGKSTLYRILATLETPDSGEASILGLNVGTDYRKIRSQIGYMPERFSLYPDLTVMENLKFFASLFGASIEENFDLIAPFFGQLEKFPNRLASRLSGGMKQKLALSCALIHRPEVLFLDEPTTGVDAVSRNEFWEILSAIREKGITIMVSTSYMDEALLCDRIALIDKGRILETGTPDTLVAEFDETLYEAVSPEMFGLLNFLRSIPGVIDCYTFGATLHLVASKDFDPKKAASGFPETVIRPGQPTLEDLFIKLSNSES